MGRRKVKSDTTKPKRQLIRTTIEKKKEIVAKYESGIGVTDIALMFKMPRTTISTIVRNKEAIKAASVAKGVKSVSKQRSQTLEEVEKVLYIWINEKELAGDSISEAIICEKARQLHADLLKDKPGTSGESTEVFKASHGWFDKFKKRTGIHSVVKHGEVNDGDVEELVEEQRTELSTEELQELQKEQLQIVAEEISAGDKEEREEASTALIKEMCSKWVEVQNFVEMYHPDKALASRNVDLINEQTMSHFRNILKHRQKQVSLDRLLVDLPKCESPAVFSEAKRQKTEETPEKSEIILEEDSAPSTSPPSHYVRNSSQYRFFGLNTGSAGELDLTEQTPVFLGSKAMTASLIEVGNSFDDPASPLVDRSRNSTVHDDDDDDDVVFIESIQPPSTSSAIADQRNFIFASSRNEKLQGNYSIILSASRDLASQKGTISETIVIDDEEDIEANGEEKKTSSFTEWGLPETKKRTKDVDFSTSSLSRRKTKTGVGPFNPGRMNVAGDEFQNGGFATHHSPDSWISQSASFPRNQKQPGVDSLAPVASLPKQIFQPSAQQQLIKPVKITCAHCKNPLQKGQTAYQRKGSANLFCSTTCLSSFSHKRTPKTRNVTCKKDAPAKRANIPQVQPSQPFQDFCSAYCVSPYEENQSLRKRILNKSRCTICSKLTEIRHEVSVNNVTHKLCSNHCFNKYRLANGLIMNCCEQCGEYLPTKGSGNSVRVVDGQQIRFCCQSCVNEYKQMLETKSKKLSIPENRKRNTVREENERKLDGSFNILLEKVKGIPEKKEKTSESQVSAECSTDASLTRQDVNLPASVSTIVDTFQEQLEEKKSEDSTRAVVLSTDPGSWPRVLNIKQRNILVENDPPQVRNFNFPKDNTGRKFSETYYTRILPNGEKTTRSWLLYSTSKDSVFCLYCKLFGEGKNQLKNENGCRDWQHLSHILSKHEESEMHINNSVKYSKLKCDLKKNQTVEVANHRVHENENSEGVLLLYT
ncbi:zinc finger MYM-type protein 5 isoform X1 [Artibeus jamaicensis]|uniref:zinc finger MYM-type protein 5 isoform X1 n=1 Tax=Artibeus jamaicensis TaxID=9417 RepID=UPI00235B1803|nr:zinc finger MYM-type protein 5 isoform X1 [Artibeus jamaicensis]XP_037012858.2 zinc finger MYM-type protein 5 isoform X1 [Artibeus jamaicensis]XP_037012859.2 zinc finger MYM-type protein 5 isoform X1 [Artibeus jamaicensis]XP_037012860.2 zinc finger MYM-type protein 5 isoform X1 [Artibeus jamaicensis]